MGYLVLPSAPDFHATLDQSSHQVRCWIKSFKADVFYPYPLKPLQCQSSRDGYIGLWMRFFPGFERLITAVTGVQAREEDLAATAEVGGPLPERALEAETPPLPPEVATVAASPDR